MAPLMPPRNAMIRIPRPPGSRRQERLRNDENRLSGIYGDHLKQKRKGTIRILFQNPQGLGMMIHADRTYTDKINKIKYTMIKHDVDVLGLSEINKDWRMVPYSRSLWNITEGWFEHRRITTAVNDQLPPRSETQYGGTILMATNNIAHRICSTQEDPSGMGRWTSILIQRKKGEHCRVICTYCPCISLGMNSAYALQTAALAKKKIYDCARKVFWEDLYRFILECKDGGETLVVMGDWNSDYDDVVTWMRNIGFHDAIHNKHSHVQPPPTCTRSRDKPIDAIFLPTSHKIWRGGFLAFDYLDGDHRGLWCDIPVEYILGFTPNQITTARARQLKTNDPRVRKRYLNKLHDILASKQIYSQFDEVFQKAATVPSQADHQQFEQIDEEITNAMMVAERQCRKLHYGQVVWSPTYQKACDTTQYWELVVKE